MVLVLAHQGRWTKPSEHRSARSAKGQIAEERNARPCVEAFPRSQAYQRKPTCSFMAGTAAAAGALWPAISMPGHRACPTSSTGRSSSLSAAEPNAEVGRRAALRHHVDAPPHFDFHQSGHHQQPGQPGLHVRQPRAARSARSAARRSFPTWRTAGRSPKDNKTYTVPCCARTCSSMTVRNSRRKT